MSTPLDPYHLWLGIPPEEQPPDYYRLLGIARFESNPAVITLAAHRQMAHVKTLAIGRYAEPAQHLLNQLARAKICLLHPALRTQYDASLRQQPASGGRPADVAAAKPPVAKPGETQSWLIGSAADCDIVVNLPPVSAHHCRLTQTPDGCFLEDLESSNGTFVNKRRVTSKLAVSTLDAIRLGRDVSMPWPPVREICHARLIRIGAAPDNDVVLDFPMISWHHALIRADGELLVIEDLDSTNGTALGTPENRIRRAAAAHRHGLFRLARRAGRPTLGLTEAPRRNFLTTNHLGPARQ